MSATAEKTNQAVPKPSVQPAAKKPAEKREYVVLRQVGPRGFELVSVGHGSTDIEAIKDATDEVSAEDLAGTFVAVPARSWKPKTRKVETVQKDSWA